MNDVIYALCLTLVAGGATGIGAALVLFMKRSSTKLLAVALGFSSGVMIYVSMIEIFNKGKDCLINVLGEDKGEIYITAAFFCGMLLIAALDAFLPVDRSDDSKRLGTTGMFTAMAIAVHNFPEGMVTFIAALKNPVMGIAICTAIAIHNIPEGIATAMPIYYSGESKIKAFAIACFSGITEPLGAVVGYMLLRPFLDDFVFGVIFGAISGVMVFISIEELLPMARCYDKGKLTITGFVCGMAIMALSLILL